jgi:L-lactate dehydrogenase complex protein LldF
MAELVQLTGDFAERARRALADEHLQDALDAGTRRLYEGRRTAWGALDDAEALRERAREIRSRTIADLDGHVATFTAALERRGGRVAVCRTSAEANEYIAGVCRKAGARMAVKSKSMVSEEIGLNQALERADVKPVETDLGEYLIQLAGTHPKHIVAPAIDLTREQAAELLSKAEGAPLDSDLTTLVSAARRQLREAFLSADVGISGANFGVAETGSICLVTNEGNGRLVTALPRVHIALMGMERLVPTLDELAVLLRLLGRSGTGQPLTVYTTLLTGPRRHGEQDGPEELHVVIVDNGRSTLRGGRYEEMLNCIRCGACLNVCPVYRKTGGGAYGPVYSGPMGAVLVPLLAGLERTAALPHASSLCGACTAACPVKIPLHELLLELRSDLVGEGVAGRGERLAFRIWSYAWSRPWAYRVSTRLARLGQPFARFSPAGRAWSRGRELPRLASRRYRDGR